MTPLLRKPLRVYVGWDKRDALAYEVCENSLLARTSIPVEVIALKDWELRAKGVYWRPYHVDERGQMWDERDGKPFSTDFSFTRFCVPLLEDYGSEPVLFMDADMLWRADIAELLDLAEPGLAVQCVKHDHRPPEATKITNNIQTVYRRKNWSSVMLMWPDRCRGLTKYAINNQAGNWLQAMCWADDKEIGSLPEEWNWLEGWSSPDIDPKIVHYTRGTPDLPEHVDAPYAKEWWGYEKPSAPQELSEARIG